MLDILIQQFEQELQTLKDTPPMIGGREIHSLKELAQAIETAPLDEIQTLSNDDILSSWLDRNCFPELAEELRPIHGKGQELVDEIISVIEKWIPFYDEREETYKLSRI